MFVIGFLGNSQSSLERLLLSSLVLTQKTRRLCETRHKKRKYRCITGVAFNMLLSKTATLLQRREKVSAERIPRLVLVGVVVIVNGCKLCAKAPTEQQFIIGIERPWATK